MRHDAPALALALLLLLSAARRASAVDCDTELKDWAQCGGLSGGGPGQSVDGPWPGCTCHEGSKCVKNDAHFYNCQPPPGAYGGGGGGGDGATAPSKFVPEPPIKARTTASGDPAYADVLALSLLFYEAQRSGKLPANNRVSWRGDSGLGDRAADGRDVSGGYYDAGDNVKFNLPLAWTTSVLAWGVYEFKDGFVAARQYPHALAAVRWGADYLVNCVGDGREIVGQVGNGQEDHGAPSCRVLRGACCSHFPLFFLAHALAPFLPLTKRHTHSYTCPPRHSQKTQNTQNHQTVNWLRPEEKRTPNPVYTINDARPGADMAGAIAAALAAASVVFKDEDPAYSRRLLDSALKAYAHAVAHPGVLYNAAIPDGGRFYPSTNAYDDMAWAAVWLAVRTGENSYKEAARKYYYIHWNEEPGGGPVVWNSFDWDSASWGDVVWLARWYPDDAFLKKRMAGFVSDWLEGGKWVHLTPKGLAYSGSWGALRHTGNALFLMEAHAKGDAALKKRVDCFAHAQMRYILGLNPGGRSYVVGYGDNPPRRPHHRASSCPRLLEACGPQWMGSAEANPHTLYGALVGGPGEDDGFADDRGNYVQSEVAIDYNAGFTGALAALVRPAAHAAECGGKWRRVLRGVGAGAGVGGHHHHHAAGGGGGRGAAPLL